MREEDLLPPPLLGDVKCFEVDAGKIVNCDFKFKCPMKWENLQFLDVEDQARFCNSCEKTVYFCSNPEELWDHVKKGNCVAVEL